jgi:hypothetical protein
MVEAEGDDKVKRVPLPVSAFASAIVIIGLPLAWRARWRRSSADCW